MPRTVALFADVGNLYYCVGKKYEGRKLDYTKYLRACVGEDTLYRAFAYGTQLGEEAVRFISCLQYAGFDTKYKKPRQVDGGREVKKVDWSVGIAMDVVRLIGRVDTVILGSADAVLVPLAEWVKEQGVRCIVHACGINRELRETADSHSEVQEQLLEVRAQP